LKVLLIIQSSNLAGANMTPSDLVGLAEVKELMTSHQYRRAIDILQHLTVTYPNDAEIHALLRVCQTEDSKNTAQWSNVKPAPMSIRIEGVSCLGVFAIFLAVFLAVIAAWLVIFFILGFQFQITPLR
jgi:hypothetical protein